MVMRKKLLSCTEAQISIAIFDRMSFKNLSDKTLARLKVIIFLLALFPVVKLFFCVYLDILAAVNGAQKPPIHGCKSQLPSQKIIRI